MLGKQKIDFWIGERETKNFNSECFVCPGRFFLFFGERILARRSIVRTFEMAADRFIYYILPLLLLLSSFIFYEFLYFQFSWYFQVHIFIFPMLPIFLINIFQFHIFFFQVSILSSFPISTSLSTLSCWSKSELNGCFLLYYILIIVV